MSIAVCAIVGPSRIHRILINGCAVALLGAALAVGLAAPGRYLGGRVAAALPLLAGMVLLRTGLIRAKTQRLDISGTGDLRLTVQQGVGMKVALLPASVVWPPLILLRLGTDEGQVHVLAVWRDTQEPGNWRALTVAIRSLARYAGQADAGGEVEKIR